MGMAVSKLEHVVFPKVGHTSITSLQLGPTTSGYLREEVVKGIDERFDDQGGARTDRGRLPPLPARLGLRLLTTLHISTMIRARWPRHLHTTKIGQSLLRLPFAQARDPAVSFLPTAGQRLGQIQNRAKHTDQISRFRPTVQAAGQSEEHLQPKHQEPNILLDPIDKDHQLQPEPEFDEYDDLRRVRVRYVRPALWTLVVSSGVFIGLAFFEARAELKSKAKHAQSWLQAPQWRMQSQRPPTPTEVVTTWWNSLNPIVKLSAGIIATNSAVHVSSVLVPRFWDTLWHLPARNVNYTQFTSMFVHSGVVHLFVNMYFVNNFLEPVGYSRLFEGDAYHTLSFFLSTGVISGFAQHWATLIPKAKRAFPETWVRCGGASGALFGILGAFCMQYPHAGLGIIFIPVHFDAQYVLPAVILFDFIGMIRGYSFVNFGHAAHLSGALIGVAYSYFDGKTRIWKPLVRSWKQLLQ